MWRKPPIDWTAGAGRSAAPRPERVDVVIPIYGAAEALRLCLESVFAHTRAPNRVILVLDGQQGEAVERIIGAFDGAIVLRTPRRAGFAESVNRGMAASATDVVLLNSDTIVTPRWVEKLIDAAYGCGDIGTVTPLSNHATLCSVPRAFEENLIPSGFDIETFAKRIEEVSARSYPRLPTGVGFCLYIRRALLNDIGLFDSRTFVKGYGEENDFCMRSLARGWLHVADDATFIYHSGHGSFGGSRMARQRRARAALAKKHPRYDATIAAWIRADPLAAVRARITASFGKRSAAEHRLRIAHLVHGWPPFQHAGAELYAYWLASRQRDRHDVSVYARASDPSRNERDAVEVLDHGTRVRLVTNLFTARDPLRRNAIRDRALERDFERFLLDERPHLLHVHHLAGHAFSLVRVARRLGIPIVMQIQDWWFLCGRVNLMDREGKRCTGPAAEKCARCATLTKFPPAAATNRIVHWLRRRAAREALAACDAFVAGSEIICRDYAGHIPRGKPFHVIPYGVAIAASTTKRAPARRPIRFGCVGSIAPHKGIHIAVEGMRDIAASDASLHIWGDSGAFPEYVASMPHRPNVVFEGRFREEDKARVYAGMDVLLVPSIGLESFCFAAREAMACGVPVIASAGGALDEMFEPGVCGEFFTPGDAVALGAILRRIVQDVSIVDRWAERIPQPKTADVHADEIERVYRSVLAERRL